MELIAGGSLAQRAGDLVHEPREAARLIANAARAIHHAHLQGICHRDVKPANVLLRVRCRTPVQRVSAWIAAQDPAQPRLGDLDACVADFGLARRTREDAGLTVTGAVVGTPGYMAPEQIRAEKPSPAGDVYGLGAALYECLTGRPPARAATPFDTLLLTLQQEPERPRVLNSRLPRDLETICLKCLEKEPRGRYASAEALADDLERWLRGEAIRARRIGPVGHTWRWCRRKPVIAGLAGLLVVALAAGLVGALYHWHSLEAALRQTEAARGEADDARREAEASDAQTRQLLTEFLQIDNTAGPVPRTYSKDLLGIDALRNLEAHFAQMLDKKPGDTRLRIALMNVRGSLGNQYGKQGQLAQKYACFRGARELWETPAAQDSGNPEHGNWLASTCDWQAGAAHQMGRFDEWLRLRVRAYGIWEELAENHPGSWELMGKLACARYDLLTSLGLPRTDWEVVLRSLEDERALLRKHLEVDPANSVLRKRLALDCLLKGEICLSRRQSGDALPYWRQAYEQYHLLTQKQPDDLVVLTNAALCCSRLAAEQSADPSLAQTAGQLEQLAHRLAAPEQQSAATAWAQAALLETYCSLAVCHGKAGRSAQAQRTIQGSVRPLVAHIVEHQAPWRRPELLDVLVRAADLLREENPSAALSLVREATAVCDVYADAAPRDLVLCERLVARLPTISTRLCWLGDPAAALRMAEQARHLCEELRRTAPAVPWYGQDLSNAWEAVAKAHWKLGRRDEALAAFRQAAAVQRQVVEQAPEVRSFRVSLSRFYDKLVYWGGQAGDRAGAADALRERAKLWPDDAESLMEASRDFHELAEAVGKGQERLSTQEKAERQGYFNESSRLKLAAEQARHRAEATHPAGTQGRQP
jgi:tetratricopeptide (TPR) repeat protein